MLPDSLATVQCWFAARTQQQLMGEAAGTSTNKVITHTSSWSVDNAYPSLHTFVPFLEVIAHFRQVHADIVQFLSIWMKVLEDAFVTDPNLHKATDFLQLNMRACVTTQCIA